MGDPEIDAMSAVVTALADLDADARARVLEWAAGRFDVVVSTGHGSPGGGIDTAVNEDLDNGVTEKKEIISAAPSFEHFAELFAKANPTTDPDKALIAAYWRQVVLGQDKWQAAELQKDLKDLGHTVGNITRALSENIVTKPQRVIQLRKAGNARQARKTYKVTHEGLAHVRGILGPGG